MGHAKLILVLTIIPTWIISGHTQDKNLFRKDTWLINIPTPYTLGKGGIELDVLGRYTRYGHPDPRTEVVDFLFVGNYGLTERSNLSLSGPFSWVSDHPDNFGINDISLAFRYGIWERNKIWIALTPALHFPTGNKDKFLGTGKINYELNANLAFRHDRLEILGNFGFGVIGYLHTEAVEIDTTFVYVSTMKSEKMLALSGALTFAVTPTLKLTLEGIGQAVPKFSDEDFYFQLGGIWQIKNSLLLKGSIGTGLPPGGRTMTDRRLVTRLSYLLN